MEVPDSLVNISIIKVITIFTNDNNNNKVCDFTCEDVMRRNNIYIYFVSCKKYKLFIFIYIYIRI